ncbi:cell division topological specificity factor MinE [Paracoccus shanxieyensis]|uniref:Cell division topological specificity factor n=1 Tax=Paracoccus shanxieyensis TaxID=2675752 RepID=A0A6L6IVI4_9RHOB|nr:cell division topological specificity factor MinE [Paracoccus shanxieyensis]MTH64233.1 cell division topological specificity factor MinE [Paracoccus shanxieyensis]MTH87377.1 cell division topological specificity factor MinE [Paracoccus shanxieyensis]
MFGFSFRQKKPSTAQTAKERLQILLAHERASGDTPDFLPLLQRDILEVVRRHMQIDGDAVDIKLERSDDLSSLEINIEMPSQKAPTRL